MVRHAPIHRRSGHSDIAICCGRNVLGSSPSTYGGAPLESGHHFESQTIQRIQNVFGRTLRRSSSKKLPREKNLRVKRRDEPVSCPTAFLTTGHLIITILGQEPIQPTLRMELTSVPW